MFIPFSDALLWIIDRVWTLLSHVNGGPGFPRALTTAEEKEAVERMQSGDESAQSRLVEHNLRLVAHIAKKYRNSAIDMDDLVSIGSIGLIKAVRSFKPESGRLSTYAARCIENEILMALRANRKTKGDVSLNAPIGSDGEGNDILLMDILGTDEDLVSDEATLRIESRRAIRLIARTLDERERTVITLRYGLADGEPHPQHEVARALGISRSYVSRIEKSALAKLRERMEHGENQSP